MSSTQSGGELPEGFADLEPFVVDWALASEAERYDKRESSSFEELQRFYDALVPRAGEALDYLDALPLDDLPPDALRLLQMLFSLATISFGVEIWKQPQVPDSGVAKILSLGEPLPV